MDSCTSGCCLLQKRKLFSAGAFAGSVTSVILAELVFTQLSHTGASVDPGQAPPLHSCLCPLFSKRHLVCKHYLVPVCRASHPPCLNHTRTAAVRMADGLHREQAPQCRFVYFRTVFLVWVIGLTLCSSQGLVVMDVPGSLGRLQL